MLLETTHVYFGTAKRAQVRPLDASVGRGPRECGPGPIRACWPPSTSWAHPIPCSSEKEMRSELSSLLPAEPPPEGWQSEDQVLWYLPALSRSPRSPAGTWRLLHLGRWAPVASVRTKVVDTHSCRGSSPARGASRHWLKSTVSQHFLKASPGPSKERFHIC